MFDSVFHHLTDPYRVRCDTDVAPLFRQESILRGARGAGEGGGDPHRTQDALTGKTRCLGVVKSFVLVLLFCRMLLLLFFAFAGSSRACPPTAGARAVVDRIFLFFYLVFFSSRALSRLYWFDAYSSNHHENHTKGLARGTYDGESLDSGLSVSLFLFVSRRAGLEPPGEGVT